MFITGAGFSANAGLPLQREFTAALLKGQSFTKGTTSKAIVSFLCDFASKIFGVVDAADAYGWPELEDLFTVIDLSANTGHHLGREYPPSKLRTVRRALIVRTIRMLSQNYGKAKKAKKEDWQLLESFFDGIEISKAGFISLNWDTVIEQQLLSVKGEVTFDYGCDAMAGMLVAHQKTVAPQTTEEDAVLVPIFKLHGSTNWLYCDNCRRLYWFPPSQNVTVSNQLLGTRDWRYIDQSRDTKARKYKCSCCEAYLGTRLATFSYTKALDFSMFQKSWFAAETLLMNAKRWIFFGYSLPAADYEFKYLLKRCELARHTSPQVVVITAGDAAAASIARYRQFFGRHLYRVIKLKPGSKIEQLQKLISEL